MQGAEPQGQDQDYAAADYLAAFDDAAKATIGVFGAPEAMDGTVNLAGHEIPATAFVGIATNDAFVHGWDLARATGQLTDLAPDLAAAILTQSRTLIADELRGDEGAPFGPEQSAPHGSSAADQLAAFCGRQL